MRNQFRMKQRSVNESLQMNLVEILQRFESNDDEDFLRIQTYMDNEEFILQQIQWEEEQQKFQIKKMRAGCSQL